MDKHLEIRKLPPVHFFNLVQILDYGRAWKHLMAIVPKNDDSFDPKYKVEHIKMIEHAGDQQRRSCAEIFLEEWGTSGRRRPDLAKLLSLLVKAQLFRAAEYVAVELLKDVPPERPEGGPAARVDVSDEAVEKLVSLVGNLETSNTLEPSSLAVLQDTLPIEQLVLLSDVPSSANLQYDTPLPHFHYLDLEQFTDQFCEVPRTAGGRKLGTGAFGSVYLGVFPSLETVAIKRLHKDAINVEKQFRNEVEALSRYRHHNLLGLLGYSCDGPSYCLVYQYMSKGSLQEQLDSQGSSATLPWQTRLHIALGSSQGILHLHSAYEKPLIHRDVKSANILLDDNLVPKLGDFGLVRLGSSGQRTQSVALTTTVFGTSAYMAPEAFRGDISVKLDTFSFGVVLLELLTSLPPFDESREGCDLVTHIEEICDNSIAPLLDTKAGNWGSDVDSSANEAPQLAENVFKLALRCLEEKRRRPDMVALVTHLQDIVTIASNTPS